MLSWRIGCSGFHYKHWKDLFYSEDLPQNKWFEYYCEHFDTVELNTTFYRFPKLPFLEGWYERSPKNFLFAVKAPRLITHFKQFQKTEEVIESFYSLIKEGLKEKLGCVLFQLPPRSAFTVERLQRIIRNLDTSFTNVLEFRHESWWNVEVYEELAKNKITFCGMSHPDLPEDAVKNNPLLYYRFHGVPDLYKSEYSKKTIQDFVEELKSTKTVKQAFVYFNNDIGGSAIRNAKEMKEIIGNKFSPENE